MRLRVGLALIMMLAMAKGHIVERRKDLMQSLVKSSFPMPRGVKAHPSGRLHNL